MSPRGYWQLLIYLDNKPTIHHQAYVVILESAKGEQLAPAQYVWKGLNL